MSWLSSFLHPGRGYDAAQEQLNKYYNQGQGRLNPYNDFGQGQITNQQTYIDSLMHPEKITDEWNKNYHESEAAKQAERLAQEHGVNAASSMGLGGSNTALSAIQAGTSQIGEQDRQKYLDDLWEKYKTGAGLSSEGVKTGAGAAGQMSQNDMTQGQNSGQMSYGSKNSGGNMLSGLIGALIGAGGSALGGTIGGAIAKRWNLSGGA